MDDHIKTTLEPGPPLEKPRLVGLLKLLVEIGRKLERGRANGRESDGKTGDGADRGGRSQAR